MRMYRDSEQEVSGGWLYLHLNLGEIWLFTVM